LDVNAVQAVRIVDVVGAISPLYATPDSLGNIVNDPWPTAFASGGFDLDGVAVIQTPEPAAWILCVAGIAGVLLWRGFRAGKAGSGPQAVGRGQQATGVVPADGARDS
jgi:hypothetical protein